MKGWVKEMITSLDGLDETVLPDTVSNGFDLRYHITTYYHRGHVVFDRDNNISVRDELRYPSVFRFLDEESLSSYLAGVDTLSYPYSPDTFTATAMKAITDVIFLDDSIYNASSPDGIEPKPIGDIIGADGSRAGAVKFMIIVTDGYVSSGDFSNIGPSQRHVSDNNINIITVGVYKDARDVYGIADNTINVDGLRYLATGDRSKDKVDGVQVVFEAGDFNSMNSINDDVIASIIAIQQVETN